MDDFAKKAEEAWPRVDAFRRQLGKLYSPERLKQAASLDQVHALISDLVIVLQDGAFTKLRNLEARVAELEAADAFKGVHQRALGYRKGAMVTHDGALWVALTAASPGCIPGTDPATWQLAEKTKKRRVPIVTKGTPA